MIDILYLAKGRPEFTQASLGELVSNTSWELVDALCLYTDGSPDPRGVPDLGDTPFEFHRETVGGPVAILNDFIRRPGAEIFAKIDNDVIVPPGWLETAAAVMAENPKLDILGLEPAFSRNVKIAHGPMQPSGGMSEAHGEPESKTRCGLCGSGNVEISGYHPDRCGACGAWSAPGGWRAAGDNYLPARIPSGRYYRGYAKVLAVGGVFLARRSAFENRAPMKPHGFNGVGGFTGWQLEHSGPKAAAEQRELEVGWIVPPLKLFLLDRLPFEPWASLSRKYIAEGTQRPWANYNGSDMEAGHLYGWWDQAGYPGERSAWHLKTANDPR